MADSVIDICNRALDMVGVERISALDDTTRSGRLLALAYPRIRREMLRGHPWNFAMRRASLPADATAPSWGPTYSYTLPADCLRPYRLNVSDPTTPWQIEGRAIVTDATAPLQILYIADIEAVGQWAPDFAAAVEARLAAEMVMPLQDNANQWQIAQQLAQQRLRIARSMDGAEGIIPPIADNIFIDARR